MMNILDLLQYDFVQRGLIAGIAAAILAPTVGIFIVAKRYAMISDTLAHVALAALAINTLLHSSPLGIIAIGTVLAALGIEYLRNTGRFSGEQVLSLFLSGSLSIAILIMSFSKTAGIQGILFGSLATVSAFDMWAMVIVAMSILSLIFFFFPQLLATVFHEELAAINGIRVRLIQYALVVCAALTITLALRIVGGLLVGALMVVPVLAAQQLRLSFVRTLLIAIFFGVLSVLVGFFLSISWNVPSGATIVLSALACFMASTVFRLKKN